MPEQISKYPDVTLNVLKGAGAVCGEGATQDILTQCPADRFCSLPTGEICVYGIDDIQQMTQITSEELVQVLTPKSGQDNIAGNQMTLTLVSLLAVVFIVGYALGRLNRRTK